MEPKQKQYAAVDVTGDRSKVRCCKEQYCIGTWNVRPMKQGKLQVVKQERALVNVDILWISKLKWNGMGEFNSDDQYIYYCWQQSLKRNGVAIIVNKRVWNAVIGCSLKNDRMISVHFQGKPFNIMVIQVDALTSNTEEAEAEWFYEDLQDLLELTTKKRCPFHYCGLECKSRKPRNIWSNRQICPWSTEWSKAKANKSFAKRTYWLEQTPFSNNTRDSSTYGHHQMVNTKIRLLYSLQSKLVKVYTIPFLLRDSCQQWQKLRSSELNTPIPSILVHWFLRYQCLLLPSPA